jgi:Spy/CpxP family protein refolding chaperone
MEVLNFQLQREQAMKSRITLLALGLALVAVPAAQAQERGQGGERRMQIMFKDITLTPAQKVKVDSVMAYYRTQLAPATPGTQPDSATMAARRTLMRKQNADLRALLTTEQQATFDRNLQARNAVPRRQDGG